MGMVMPSPPVRRPGMTDSEWRAFLMLYRREVFDPMEARVEANGRFASVGLVIVAATAIVLILWSISC